MMVMCRPSDSMRRSAGEFEGMGAEEFSPLECEADLRGGRAAIAGRGEMHSVAGEYSVDLVGQGLDQCFEKISRNPLRGFLLHRDEGELRASVDGDEEVQLALPGANLGDIDVEVADRVGLELLAAGPVAR